MPLFCLLVLPVLITGCDTPPPQPAALPEELVLHNWFDALPTSIMDQFTEEYGIKINYQGYISYEEAVTNIQAGNIYDLVFIGTVNLGTLIEEGRLAKLSHGNLPNMRNISANFRDLVYDPNNSYSVPYTWGTTGILVRSDRMVEPLTRWSDLWDTRYMPVGIWDDMRTTIGFTLQSLGYSINSEEPIELAEAREKLLKLKAQSVFLEDYDLDTSAYALADGDLNVAVGWAYDILTAAPLNPTIQYVIPKEGTILWGECIVIPSNSPNQAAAELFIDFLLRPEISAQYTNETNYATTNDAALSLVDQTILDSQVVFPKAELLQHAEILLPLSTEGVARYTEIWTEFIALDVSVDAVDG
ncbi:MAG: spermidine/putrescine ABC transporter substrate-binding protein [Anaerolineae bacterium]|nr:spermidine/putrescine ABC transporter substrate-binding protein [Anaerolineae bacterium]